MTRLATLMLALALAFGLSGCGGDDAPADDTPSAEATDAAADDTSGDDAPSAPPVFTNGPGDVTLTFTGGEGNLGGGAFEQSEVKISVGQIVEFQAGDKGTYGVKVGGLDGVTISGGLKQYYRFDAAGRYPVEEEISGSTAVIVVE